MLRATSDGLRQLLLVVLTTALLGMGLLLGASGADARRGTVCQDIANRNRVATLSGKYQQANAAREILDYSSC